MTLIRSNPLFKVRRSEWFSRHLNHKHKSVEEITAIFRQTDKTANAVNEKTGGNLDAEELYLWVIAAIHDYDTAVFDDVDITGIYQTMENLLWEYPPELYDPRYPETLGQLSQFSTLNLLSNTGFIKGATLRKVLKIIDLEPFFQFQLYSDETGWSKPNRRFFDLMIQEAARLHPDQPLLQQHIIHTGDNPVADVAGAEAAGIDGFLVHHNAALISGLLTK